MFSKWTRTPSNPSVAKKDDGTRGLLLFSIALALTGGLLTTTMVALARPAAVRAAPTYRGAGDASAIATFAGGCFWCVESAFEKPGLGLEAVSGYTGGEETDPSYGEVSSGRTGHREAVQIRYDPVRVSYDYLLELFWRSIDPTDDGGQFADRGSQYRTGIFFHDDAQRRAAKQSRDALARSGHFSKPITVEILPAGPFFAAESSHQDYWRKNPAHYKRYFRGSGRAGYIERVWSGVPLPSLRPEHRKERSYMKPSPTELRKRLSREQYDVTQNDSTEPPFRNAYWDNKEEGIYVDVASGEPLFSSTDKFDSGTGWPSFSRPLVKDHIVQHSDRKLLMERTEVRSKIGDSHLGHLFDDGPAPTGQRYCINSASLRFVPRKDLEREGYGEFASLFED